MGTFSLDEAARVVESSLAAYGAVILRGVIPPGDVAAAREKLLRDLVVSGHSSESGDILSSGPLDEGPNLLNRQDLAHSALGECILAPELLVALLQRVYANRRSGSSVNVDHTSTPLEIDCSSLLSYDCDFSVPDPSAVSIPYKWLRAVGTGKYTGLHMDRVYFKAPESLVTAWIPLGSMGPTDGSLIMSPGSNVDPRLRNLRQTYGVKSPGSDGAESGWLSPEALQGLDLPWTKGNFSMGDVVLLGLDTLHQTLPNLTNSWRLSVEVRWMDIHDAALFASRSTSSKNATETSINTM